jgi:hypothetical protein
MAAKVGDRDPVARVDERAHDLAVAGAEIPHAGNRHDERSGTLDRVRDATLWALQEAQIRFDECIHSR